MTDILSRFESAAKNLASLNHYPYADRYPAWLERLKVNLPELQMLENMPDTAYNGYQAPSAGSVPSGGEPDFDEYPGIAAIAREARQRPDTVADAALQSLSAAQNHKDLNAFTRLATPEGIVKQAAVADAARRAGEPMPLFGVPVAIKDLMLVAGFRLTGGTQSTDDAPSATDAAAVGRLRSAGALIIGTTNLHELAYGITSANPHYGSVRNPRAPDCIPGGSSGGSAAAVAAGIVRASVGTDTAGSIRIPAACCGVVGFKPTYDAITRQGALDLGPSLDHLGPITRSVGDAALMFSVMAGMTPQVPRHRANLHGVTIGVPSHYFFDPLSAEMSEATHAAFERMRADGAELTPVDLPGLEIAPALQFATLCSEATDIHLQRLMERPDSLGEDVRVRLEIGMLFPAVWYTRAQRLRAALAATFNAAMAEVDVLVTPTLRVSAPRSGEREITVAGRAMPLHTAMTSLTLPFNLTGMPAITLPFNPGGSALPVGIQFAARRGNDWALLSIASRAEAIFDSTR